jgi:hypothetical protein
MRTSEQIRTREEEVAARRDPEELWLDQSVQPEELVRLDPLEVTAAMEEQAEQPELTDFVLQRLA